MFRKALRIKSPAGVFRSSGMNRLCEREPEIGHVIICDGLSDCDVSLTASVSYRSEVVDLSSRAVYVSSLGSEIYRRDRRTQTL